MTRACQNARQNILAVPPVGNAADGITPWRNEGNLGEPGGGRTRDHLIKSQVQPDLSRNISEHVLTLPALFRASGIMGLAEASERLRLAPCTVKAAKKLVKTWHRHLPDVQGGLFAVKVMAGDRTIGVGLAGNPCYRWQGQAKLVIARVATEGADNACSMIYGALCRAAKALGYAEVWTYTLPEEPGTSLRAAGFMDMGVTRGGEYDRPSRSRAPAKRPEPKRRWLRQLASRPSMDGGAG